MNAIAEEYKETDKPDLKKYIECFPEVFPQKLKERRQWVLWKPVYNAEKNKVDKIPVNAKNYRNASSTDPATWSSFDEALAALIPGYGLGYVLAADDWITGVDLDKCVTDGVIEPWAQAIIKGLNSYTEISPSGTGIRIFVEAAWPPGGNRKDKVEVYDRGRYLTVTGKRLAGTPADVESRQEALDNLHSRYFNKPAPVEVVKPAAAPVQLSESKILEIARKSKQGVLFTRLLNGEWEGIYESQSQADQAFCNMLAFWFNKDFIIMDRIFRGSGLYRAKWDEIHGAQTYGQMTIDKAIADTRNVFEPKSRPQDDFANSESPKKEAYFNEEGTFIPAWLAEDLMIDFHIKYAAGDFWIEVGGVYHPGGEPVLAKLAQDKLGSATRTNRIKEALDYIKRETYTELPKPNMAYINLKNGRLDWRTGELHGYSPDCFEIVQLPVVYDPAASCPVFDNYLKTTLDKDSAQLALEIMGYCLRPDTRFEKAFMLTGTGRNGKSIFLSVIDNLIGSDNVSHIALQDLEENKFKAAGLLGKLVNTFADLDSRALKSTTLLKLMTSGDPIDAEKKFKDGFTFVNYARMLFSANTIPRSSDSTFGFYERWIILPFEKVFDADNSATDPDLREKLTDPGELSGILNRALIGLQTLYLLGSFTQPKAVREALNEYKRQNDSVLSFCDECISLGGFVSKTMFYAAYRLWCEQQGLHPVSQKKLKPSLMQAFPNIQENREGNLGPRGWNGIRLNDDAPIMEDFTKY